MGKNRRLVGFEMIDMSVKPDTTIKLAKHIYTYTFESCEKIDLSTMQISVRMPINNEPKKVSEFVKKHNINKKKLIDWLNENYHK